MVRSNVSLSMSIKFDTSWKTLEIRSEPYWKHAGFWGYQVFASVKTSTGRIDELALSRKTLAAPLEKARNNRRGTLSGLKFAARKTSHDRRSVYEVNIPPQVAPRKDSNQTTVGDRRANRLKIAEDWIEFTIVQEPHVVYTQAKGYQVALGVRTHPSTVTYELLVGARTLSNGIKACERTRDRLTNLTLWAKRTTTGYKVVGVEPSPDGSINRHITQSGQPAATAPTRRAQMERWCNVCNNSTIYVRERGAVSWECQECGSTVAPRD